jgi:hypothetical protein
MGKLGSRLLVLAGALWTLGMGWVVVNAGGAYFRAGDAPVPAKVADAPQERWIQLEDAKPHCETRTVQRGFTYFLADAPQGGAPFVVQLSGDVPCEGAAIDGGFIPGRFSRPWLKEKLGLELPGEGELRFFTQALSPRYLRGVLVKTVAFLVAGLAVLAIGIRSLRRAGRAPAA